MSSSKEVRHGIAKCEDCETIQPVEVRPDEELAALGNPNCECGGNAFRLMD
jgi:hypothetical protein